MSAPIPIELVAAAEPPRLLPPRPDSLFAERARRFAELADGHALGGWLELLGALSLAQHRVALAFPAVPLPERTALAGARRHAMPPLPARAWRRDPAWLTGLRQLAAALIPVASPAAAISLAALGSDDDEWLESLADQVIDPTGSRRNADLLPYVGAALEVYWTVMASRLAGELAPLDVAGVCPCCGFLPVASVVRADAGNRRYLHCALCNTEWNLVRVTCAACGGVEGIAYQQIEGGDGKLRAETCDGCHGYLKILYGGAQADPVADDLAGLALDLLVDGLGYRRIGPNLLFIPGEA